MTGTQSANRGLTRRDFLKVGVAGATGLAAAGSMTVQQALDEAQAECEAQITLA